MKRHVRRLALLATVATLSLTVSAQDLTTPEQKVRAYYALFGEASESSINQLVHEDYALEDAQLGMVIDGREAFQAMFVPGGNRVYPITVIAYFGDDRAGAVHVRVRWPTKYIAPAWGLSGTDEEIEFEAVGLITFRDGKIASHLDFWDSGLLYQRLGGDFPNPDASKFGVREGGFGPSGSTDR